MNATNAMTNARRSNVTNVKFANDGSLESVDMMLRKISAKCFTRVSAMGLGMEFEDVLQEMYVSYVKAKEKWNPANGALFSTYCTTVCLNNFNAAIKKMERQRSLGKIPQVLDEITGKMVEPKFQREFGMLSECELNSVNQDRFEVSIENTHGNAADEPHYRLSCAQETNKKIKNLSAGAKRLVTLLLNDELRSAAQPMRLRELAKAAQLQGGELRQVKVEILKKFGVTWQ